MNKNTSNDKDWFTQFGGYEIKDLEQKNKWEHLGFIPSNNQTQNQGKEYGYSGNGSHGIKREYTLMDWKSTMSNFNEVILISAVPILTILFVFFVYALVRLLYNYVKLLEARSKKEVSELKDHKIEDFEENY